MGIHYDYKSKRGERAMLKEAKRKARLAQKRAKKLLSSESSVPAEKEEIRTCLLYTSPSPRDLSTSRMPSSA